MLATHADSVTRRICTAALLAALTIAVPAAAQRTRTTTRAGATKLVTTVACAADLGQGVKSHRAFCDVLIGAKPTDSVSMTIPPHVGGATLFFDLHNRFSPPLLAVPGPLSFARHEAVVAVVRPGGEILGRAAAVREFRTPADLFDQIGGGSRPGGVKAVAPGPAESIRIAIPAGVSTVGIVGTRLTVLSRAGRETFDTPGRPVAIVSNLRIEYRPAR